MSRAWEWCLLALSDAVDIEGGLRLRQVRCYQRAFVQFSCVLALDFRSLPCELFPESEEDLQLTDTREKILCINWMMIDSIRKSHITLPHLPKSTLLFQTHRLPGSLTMVQGDTSCFACSSSVTVKLPFLLADLLSSSGFRPGTETAMIAVVISSILRTSAKTIGQLQHSRTRKGVATYKRGSPAQCPHSA